MSTAEISYRKDFESKIAEARSGESDLTGMSFIGLDLSGEIIKRPKQGINVIQGVSCSDLNLQNTSWKNCNMQNMILRNSDLRGADFTGSNLKDVNLIRANIENAIFLNSNITSQQLLYTTGAKKAKFSNSEKIHSELEKLIQEQKQKTQPNRILAKIMRFFLNLLGDAPENKNDLNQYSDMSQYKETKADSIENIMPNIPVLPRTNHTEMVNKGRAANQVKHNHK